MEELHLVNLEMNELELQEELYSCAIFAFPAHQVSIESNETQYFTFENCLQVKTCRLKPG